MAEKAWVVYDSFFGNTKAVAEAVGDALSETHEVEVIDVKTSPGPVPVDVSLVVVGSPTRAFKPTAAISDWLKAQPRGSLAGKRIAAFDTRASLEEVNSKVLNAFVSVFGYAAEPIEKKLIRSGGTSAGSPAGFFVKDKEGPLFDGEIDRVKAWARGLKT